VDLSDWKDHRTLKGPFKLERVTLTDAAGNIKDSFRYGEKIRIQTDVSGVKGETFCMRVSVKSAMGIFITDHITWNDGFHPVFQTDKATVTSEFDCLFSDGTYYIQIWLGDRTRKGNDIVRNCLSFDVFSGDTAIRNRGLVRQPVSWSEG
jgi:hypothetical protein